MIVVMLLATADPTNGIAKDGPGATGSKASKADERERERRYCATHAVQT